MKRIKIGLLLAMLSLVLIACGGTQPPVVEEAAPTAEQPAEEEPTEEPVEEEPTEEPVEEEPTEEPVEEEPTEEPAEEEAMAEEGPITIGMMKIVSHPALDAIQASFLETLAEGGYVEGDNLTIIDGNAEGDIATLTTIAQQFVDEEVDLIATTSTPALQAAYNVTKDMENPIPIIFNAVTSPYAAGIATAPDDHPAWVLGTQIFPPIAATFDVMQETFPDGQVIGYLYNPAEANSVAQFEETEPIAEELGYTLEIGTISNSSEVKTAAEALVARGIDFFYYGQDSTMASGAEGLIQVANENAIPIITNDMPGVGRGVALGVGLDFSEDGKLSGQYAVEFLNGELDLATAEIVRVETTEYHYNTAAAELQGVTIPQSIVDNGLDKTPGAEASAEEEEAAEEEAMAEKEDITIGMMKIVSHPALDAIQASFLETLAEGGYVEGENLTIIDGNAEGDIATLTTIAQQFVDEEVDLIATTSTPALQAAYNVTKDMEPPIPIIFNAVTSPYAAGIANAPDDHPAWVLGTQIFPPIAATFDVMQEAFPDAKVIGYLYNPAEANSVAQFEETEPIVEELGYTLEIGTISNSSEVKTAAEALVARGIDFFYYGQDSTMASGAEGLIQVANENAIPVITNDMPGVGRGIALGVGLDFSEDGKLSGQYAVQFLDGELDLATAEIVRVETTEYHYNTDAAELQGVTIPQSILDEGLNKTPGAEEDAAEEEAAEESAAEEEAEKGPITIGMMKIVSHPALDSIQASFLETLAEGGYVEGENLTIIDGNAEGDIATLTTIAQQFVDEEVDLIATTSTPALQAAYNVTKDMEPPIPIIFNAVTSPYAAGIATAPDDHPAWLLGTQIFPPIAATFDVMQEAFPDAQVIGYLYNPAEANSVAQFEETEPIAEELGYTLEIGTISNSSEVKTAAEALVARGIDFFYYSQDSTMASGAEGLIQVANENAIPIITNDMPGVGRGVALGVGLDFSEDGKLSGQYAVEFLNGELDLATAEIVRVETTEYHYNTDAADLQGVTIPQSILDEGLDKTP